MLVLGVSYESFNVLDRVYMEMFGFEVPETLDEVLLHDTSMPWMRVYQGVRFNPSIDTLSISTVFCQTLIKYGNSRLETLRFVSLYSADSFKRDVPRDIDVELEFPSVMALFLSAPNLEKIHLKFGISPPEYWYEKDVFALPDSYTFNFETPLKDYWDI
ncbi:uncharacterized protein RAG0_03560 [Rhynchosporium agropyri]|uniref:Uncharacterized protein n=1 Tax=Rhynchosporium agropyri TaxID=914238 RepID=A0A1E1K4Z3_9HELO|nr:uncharacterized protein RAG0_03560 [Rhynchosporium agropyri]